MVQPPPHRIAVVLGAATLLVACHRDPTAQQGEALRDEARQQAKLVQAQGDAQAKALDEQAKGLADQAKEAGGYDGERLKVRSDALFREADIVKRQARTRAEATTEAADARAKSLQSR